MSSDFERALLELADEAKPLTRRLLANFSDPTRSESETFIVCLQQMSAARRREVMVKMVEFAEENFELDYVALFRRCLDDPDPVVRRYAVEGLWEDDRPDLVDLLVRLLSSDPDIQVRAAAATSVGRFVYQAEGDELDERRAKLIRETLERVIDDPYEDIEVVRRAVESIAYINDDRVRRIIDRAYAHHDQRMRESAVFAMGRSADPIWAETVMAELYDASPAMRYEAARACGELQLKRAVDTLIKLAEGPDREIQAVAVWALGQTGGKRAEAALERWLHSDDEILSAAAAEALDELKFSGGSLDLLVYELDEGALTDIDLVADEDEFEDEDDLADNGWADDAIDLG